jgi:RNA polymerase sigma factor (sigma-70 family)
MGEEHQLPQGVEAAGREEQAMRWERDRLVQQFAREHGGQLVQLAARLVGRSNAEDVAQDAFESLAKLIAKRPEREVMALLRTQEDLRKLMCKITACRAYEHLRRRSRIYLTGNGMDIEPVDSAGLQDSELKLDVERLERAYQNLSPMQRIVHVLHHYYGFTDADVAATLGISKTNSRSMVCRATRALKSAMEQTR